jgi:hypothetical protein
MPDILLLFAVLIIYLLLIIGLGVLLQWVINGNEAHR